jgi:hypothetical protein
MLKLPFLILLVAIAVPAVGGIFGAIVAYSDFKRTMKERTQGNRDPMIAFGVAFGRICCIFFLIHDQDLMFWM